MGKIVGIAEFKANCTRLIAEMERDGQPITVTRHGKAVGVLSPAAPEAPPASLYGCMKGTVLWYDDPFEPAFDPSEWDVNR